MREEKFKFRAFTLAEVLITLAIVAVVAALTIPALLNYAFERQAVSKAKNTTAVLIEAWRLWQNDKNCSGDNGACFATGYNAWLPCQIAQELTKYIKMVDIHYSWNENFNNVSWVPTTATALDGSSGGFVNKICGNGGVCAAFLMQDDTAVIISSDYGPDTHMSKEIIFGFDINNSAPPNRVGKDQFMLVTDRKSLVPFYYNYFGAWTNIPEIVGLCNQATSGSCQADGHSPLAYVLANDKLPDLKAMGYPTTP